MKSREKNLSSNPKKLTHPLAGWEACHLRQGGLRDGRGRGHRKGQDGASGQTGGGCGHELGEDRGGRRGEVVRLARDVCMADAGGRPERVLLWYPLFFPIFVVKFKIIPVFVVGKIWRGATAPGPLGQAPFFTPALDHRPIQHRPLPGLVGYW